MIHGFSSVPAVACAVYGACVVACLDISLFSLVKGFRTIHTWGKCVKYRGQLLLAYQFCELIDQRVWVFVVC